MKYPPAPIAIPQDMRGIILAPVKRDPNLGFYVLDEISGFHGTIIEARHTIEGTIKYLVQPDTRFVEYESESTPQEFDGSRLTVIKLERGASGGPPVKHILTSQSVE